MLKVIVTRSNTSDTKRPQIESRYLKAGREALQNQDFHAGTPFPPPPPGMKHLGTPPPPPPPPLGQETIYHTPDAMLELQRNFQEAHQAGEERMFQPIWGQHADPAIGRVITGWERLDDPSMPSAPPDATRARATARDSRGRARYARSRWHVTLPRSQAYKLTSADTAHFHVNEGQEASPEGSTVDARLAEQLAQHFPGQIPRMFISNQEGARAFTYRGNGSFEESRLAQAPPGPIQVELTHQNLADLAQWIHRGMQPNETPGFMERFQAQGYSLPHLPNSGEVSQYISRTIDSMRGNASDRSIAATGLPLFAQIGQAAQIPGPNPWRAQPAGYSEERSYARPAVGEDPQGWMNWWYQQSQGGAPRTAPGFGGTPPPREPGSRPSFGPDRGAPGPRSSENLGGGGYGGRGGGVVGGGLVQGTTSSEWGRILE